MRFAGGCAKCVSDCGNMAASLESLVLRLEAVATRLEALDGNANCSESEKGEEKPEVEETIVKSEESMKNTEGASKASCVKIKGPSVAAFDEIYNGKVLAYVGLSAKIGGEVNAQAELVKKAFDALRELLCTAETTAKPSDSDLPKFLKSLADCIAEVSNYRDKNRASKFFNHLSAVSESVSALGWVSVSPAPRPFVEGMADAGQFYGNRVLKDYKNKDQDHVNWVKEFQGIWVEMMSYIKQNHTTGLSWNAKGAVGAPPPPPPAGGAPPPPPPIAAPSSAPVVSGGDSSGRGALLVAINTGSSVTSGLKKVTNDMKTHKNPALRGASTVPANNVPAKHIPSSVYVPKPFQASRPVTRPVIPKKTPVKELQAGKKWIVENFEKNRNIVIGETSIKQTVYIYNCKESTIVIKGKINGVILDSCKKTAVVVDDLIASLEFVNCQSVQSQINGEVPLVSIDKTDGVQVYLSEKSKNAEIVTAKSSEMNILVPKGNGEFGEYALPEQYKSVWNGKGFVTVPTDST